LLSAQASIPQDTNVRETPAYGKNLWDYCPRSLAVIGYDGSREGGYVSTMRRVVEVISGQHS
jgi:hypothetical protein